MVGVNVIEVAADAVNANDEVTLLDELTANDAVPVSGPMNELADTVVANMDPVTINPDGNDIDPVKNDAVWAYEAVPNNEPVTPPLTTAIDPVVVIPRSPILTRDTDWLIKSTCPNGWTCKRMILSVDPLNCIDALPGVIKILFGTHYSSYKSRIYISISLSYTNV